MRERERRVVSERLGRRCRRCGDPIQWKGVRLIGRHPYCSEACAILSLSDEASRTAWIQTTLELGREPRALRRRIRLAVARGRAHLAQRRLNRRLDAGPRAENLPWFWVPRRRALAGLALALAAWGMAVGQAPGSGARAPINVAAAPQLGLASTGPVEIARASSPLPPPAAVSPSPQLRPSPWVAGTDVARGDPGVRQIAFTFDGGDQANVADEILDSLRAQSVRVTMFLTGEFIRRFPDMVRRMVADGHEIANHTDTHPRLTTYAQNRRHQTLPGVTRAFVMTQLREAEASFRALTGRPMAPYWRAPYGEQNAGIRAWAAEAGYRHISWTRGAGVAEDLDTRDWVADRSSRIYRSREEIAARILSFGRERPEGLNGGIVLMHLGTNRATDRPHEGLPSVLKSLREQGYRLVTVSELLREGSSAEARVARAETPLSSPGPQVRVR